MAEQSSFKQRLERLALPYVLIAGVATSLAKVEGIIAQNGLKIVAASVTLISALWVLHVFKELELSMIAGGEPRPKYGTKHRLSAIALLLLSLAPLWLTFRPVPTFEVPRFSVIIWNHADKEMNVSPHGFFTITMPVTPVNEDQLASGKVELRGGDQMIVVPPGKSTSTDGRFVSSRRLQSLFKRGNLNFRIVLHTSEWEFLNSFSIPFTNDWITGEQIAFTYEK